MPFWQRLLFTIIVIGVASFVAGLIWHRLFGFSLPAIRPARGAKRIVDNGSGLS